MPKTSEEQLRTIKFQYLGTLGLLAELSVYLGSDPECFRPAIEQALDDAIEAGMAIRWRRVMDRIEVEVIPATETPHAEK